MEGINIMPGSIRPVSANCEAGMELKEAMGYEIDREGEESAKRGRARRKRESRMVGR